MNRYFLFGQAVCQGMAEDDIKGAKIAINRGEPFDIFEWKPTTDPTALLYAFSGWEDFCEINQKEYKQLEKLIL